MLISVGALGVKTLRRQHILRLLVVTGVALTIVPCEATKRRFTVADDITLTHFGDPYTGEADPVTFSPDRRYFVVCTERGLLEQNRPESTLRVFRTDEVQQFASHPNIVNQPLPVWSLSKSTYKDAPIITHINWLVDSTEFAFLLKAPSGNNQLLLANIKKRTILPLTPEHQDVTAFRIRDRSHYVYSVLSPDILNKAVAETRATTIVGTGRSLPELLFPSSMSELHDLSDLWAVIDGKSLQVLEKSSGQPIHLYSAGQNALALSPSGRSVITALAARTVPSEWESLYPPPYPSSAVRIEAGQQNVGAFDGLRYVSEFVLIDLSSGETRPLTGAPIGDSAGWVHAAQADWSADGHEVVLSNAFVPLHVHDAHDPLNRPCVAVVDIASGSMTCLERLKGQTAAGYEEGYRYVESVRFASGKSERVMVNYQLPGGTRGTTTYIRLNDGSWKPISPSDELKSEEYTVEVSVNQSFRDPPVLVATDTGTGTSRVIFDPNPQLKDIDLGEASVLKWKDNTGREWIAGLYKPPDYHPGERYPLVLQTHDFFERNFEPSGVYPTAFAARELAAVGILVLQVNECTIISTPDEASCNVAVYESAVDKLIADGLVDQNRIGIIGFSRTCYHVLEALTSSTLHFRAASITDGVNFGYVEYIISNDFINNSVAHDANAVMRVPPWGDGLQQWLKTSPGFNMDKVMAPLQVVANGRLDLLNMWEPYAVLRFLHKPVDLILLPGGTHILTNPGERMVSQGGTVDWFRFWLQGDEDPDPAKAEQYKRWRELRKLQQANNARQK